MSRRNNYEDNTQKTSFVFLMVLFISIFVFISLFTAYSKKLKSDANKELSKLNKESEIVDNNEIDKIRETSFSKDATVTSKNMNNLNTKSNTSVENNNKEKKSIIENSNKISSQNLQEENADLNNTSKNIDEISKTNDSNNSNTTYSNLITNENLEENVTLSFIAPVSGEITKDYSIDTLVYSNTLKEWTTHNGIDIKADKTSIVVASEAGVVESIKNDPRFGLTITITHDNGFKTIYSNLLTTEFVKENEKVERGQTIATIGDSASFEIADDSHLHFEMYKDGETVNPTIYLKDA